MIEIAIPLSALGQLVEFAVIVERELDGRRALVERYPAGHPISLHVPTPEFDAANWRT